ncbi:MAG: hypothetical protein ACOX87_11945 [Chloroflexota bacterium]|jgi:K+ transporter
MSPEPIAIVRDISIILLALGSFVFVLILILIGWKVYQLVKFLRAKSEEFSVLGATILSNATLTAEKASDTATTVKGSAEFISDTVVTPVVQVVSAVSGAKGFVAALFKEPNSFRRGGRT